MVHPIDKLIGSIQSRGVGNGEWEKNSQSPSGSQDLRSEGGRSVRGTREVKDRSEGLEK